MDLLIGDLAVSVEATHHDESDHRLAPRGGDTRRITGIAQSWVKLSTTSSTTCSRPPCTRLA